MYERGDVFGYGTSCRRPLLREVAEHAGEFGIDPVVQSGDSVERDLAEDALQDGLAVLVRREVGCRVGAEGGLDQRVVVAAQGLPYEVQEPAGSVRVDLWQRP